MSQSLHSNTLFSDYTWKQSSDDPYLFTRRGFGMEVLCDLMPRIDRYKTHGNSCVSVKVRFTQGSTLSLSQLHQKVQLAWELTRLRIPNLAVTVDQDEDGWTQLAYRVPKSYEDLRAWSNLTLKLSTGSLEEVRNRLGGDILPDIHGNQLFLYLLPDDDLQGFGLSTHQYHTAFDLAGTLMVHNVILKELAQLLEPGALDAQSMHLGAEVGSLLPACDHNLLPPNQFDNVREIEEGMLRNTRLMKHMPRDPGLDAASKGGYRVFKYYFERKESERLLRAIKSTGYTVNQIAHAAIILVVLNSNPPDEDTPADAKLHYTTPIDLRRHLKPPYAGRHAYPGFCVLSAPIEIPLSICNQIGEFDKMDHNALLSIAEILKSEYKRSARMQDGLRSFNGAIERMIREQGIDDPNHVEQVNEHHKTRPPPATTLSSRIQAYSGDGVGEVNLNPFISDSNGNTVLDIVDHFVAVNMSESIPGFRMHSWRGKFHLTLNFNDRIFDEDAMQGFLSQWADYIRLILGVTRDKTQHDIRAKL